MRLSQIQCKSCLRSSREVWLFPLNTLPPSRTLPRTGLPTTDPTDPWQGGGGCLTEMCRLGFKVTHTSTCRTIPPPVPRPTPGGGKCAQRAAATTPHPHRHRGCNLPQPPWRCREGLEGWGELAVFSPPPPPGCLHPSSRAYQLVEGVSFLEGGSGSRAAVCPFPWLGSVPSGLCCAWLWGEEGPECRKHRGKGREGLGKPESVWGF